MKTILTKASIILLLTVGLGRSQGFVNLDFEDAVIDLSGSYQNFITNAFPGWTVNALYVMYNDISLSGSSISIIDTNSSWPPIQEKYFALLASANYPPTATTISLGQIVTIPLWAQSITFWGSIGGMQVTFDGNPLLFSAIGSGSNYTIYGADISAYANQTGELLFALPPYVANATLDNIQFSSTPVPEPGIGGLLTLGGLLLGWRRWRKSIV